MEPWIIPAVIGVFFSVIGWLLADKDKKQGKEIEANKIASERDIENIYKMCHNLTKDLAAFQLKLAENYYPSHELDKRFEQLNGTVERGFGAISTDLKEVMKAVHEHFKEHHLGEQTGSFKARGGN